MFDLVFRGFEVPQELGLSFFWSVVWKSCCFARNMKQRRSFKGLVVLLWLLWFLPMDPYVEADNDNPYQLWTTNAWPFQNNWKCHFSQYQAPARLSIWLTHPRSIKLTWSILKCFLLFQWVSIKLSLYTYIYIYKQNGHHNRCQPKWYTQIPRHHRLLSLNHRFHPGCTRVFVTWMW